MTKVMIRQPGYLPNIGFFKKIECSDIFIYLDNVQFAIRAWDNRNKIKTNKGSIWLTVPVVHPYKKKLHEVEISYTKNWQQDHINKIESYYRKSPYFEQYWNEIKEILTKKWKKIIDLNLELIEYFNGILSLKIPRMRTSQLGISSSGSKMLLDICKKAGAKTYISGKLGHQYLKEEILKKAGIRVIYENFQHPRYKQIHGSFLPNMSIIDLIFNEGENAQKIIQNSKNL